LGCLFAGRLAHAGIQVSLVDYRKDRAALLNKTGITITTLDGDMHQRIEVITKGFNSADILFVLVKSHATASLQLPQNTPVLTLQNGLGNAEILSNSGLVSLMAGATSEAVTWLDTGHVRHAASGKTIFGAWTFCDTVQPLNLLQRAGFDAEVTKNPAKAIWKKAIINAGINPLTALLNLKNGALLEREETVELLRILVLEAVSVAEAEGYHFDCDLVEETLQVCSATCDNESSMLQDIRNSRRTEIDAISGEILRRAHRAGLKVPHTQTIYNLVRTREQL